jgi:hypothetical protein
MIMNSIEADSTRPATWFADDATGIPKHYGVTQDSSLWSPAYED